MTKRRGHEQLQRLFVRATERYLRRRDHWLLLHAAGAHERTEQRACALAQEAVSLVARLATRHPMAPMVDALWPGGPVHRQEGAMTAPGREPANSGGGGQMSPLPSDAAIATELERVLMQLVEETERAVLREAELSAWLPEQLAEARGRIWTMMEMYRRLHAGDATDRGPEVPHD